MCLRTLPNAAGHAPARHRDALPPSRCRPPAPIQHRTPNGRARRVRRSQTAVLTRRRRGGECVRVRAQTHSNPETVPVHALKRAQTLKQCQSARSVAANALATSRLGLPAWRRGCGATAAATTATTPAASRAAAGCPTAPPPPCRRSTPPSPGRLPPCASPRPRRAGWAASLGRMRRSRRHATGMARNLGQGPCPAASWAWPRAARRSARPRPPAPAPPSRTPPAPR